MPKIHEVGILVGLKISMWQGRIKDKNAARVLAIGQEVHINRLSVNKMLINRMYLDKIQSSAQALRAIHEKYTLPWDRGARLLPIQHYQSYYQAIDKEINAFNHHVAEFVENYETVVKEGKESLGRLFHGHEYPPSWSIKHRFGIDKWKMPIPAGSHILSMDMDEAILGGIRDDVEKATGERLKQAMQKPYREVGKAIQRLLDKIVLHDGEKAPIFRDSTLDTVHEMIQLLPGLNVVEDPTLQEIHGKLSDAFYDVKADDLRPRTSEYNKEKHERVVDTLTQLNESYGAYFQVDEPDGADNADDAVRI